MPISIDDYYHLFPDGDGSLKKRLHSQSARDRQSAEFELLLHETFRRSGCHLVPHPYVPCSAETPDFLVSTPDKTSFYLEATVVTGTSDQLEKAEARKAPLLAKLGQLRRDGIRLDFGINGTPEKSIGTRAILTQVQAWLACLDAEALRRRHRYLKNHAERYHRFRLRHREECEPEWREPDPPSSPAEETSLGITLDEDCQLFVCAWPEDERPRGLSLRTLCQPFLREPEIKKKVTKKARKYGAIDKPLLIAVNVMRHCSTPLRDMAANFSDEILGYRNTDFDEDDNLVEDTYVSGVLWPTANRKVSGVLVFTHFEPGRVKDSYARWIVNPWARLQLTRLPIDLEPFDPEAYLLDEKPNAAHLLGLL